tara:strand:+ start:5136 stop:5429 length:294 start_codon:yes stop_codon:yes gene_type:complete
MKFIKEQNQLKAKLFKKHSYSEEFLKSFKEKREREKSRNRKLSKEERVKLLKIKADLFKRSGLSIDDVKKNAEISRKKLLRTEDQILQEYKYPTIHK